MSGRLIHIPPKPHSCTPPPMWFDGELRDSRGTFLTPGTVWECTCGNRRMVKSDALGFLHWGRPSRKWRKAVVPNV